MTYAYLVTPLVAWLLAGSLKFLVNSVKAGKLAFDLIGYGGMPSNHSAIVCSMPALIAIKEGVAAPAFGVAIALAFVVMLDANSLRRKVGEQAAVINRLAAGLEGYRPLRERMGHTRAEIAAGALVGCAAAWLVQVSGI